MNYQLLTLAGQTARQMRRAFLRAVTVGSLICTPVIAQNASIPADKSDNSRRNAADQPTAEDQSNSPQDMEVTRNLRRQIVQNDSLSETAKNVKIITNNGKVILRGPVKSQEERRTIAAMAEQIAGKGNVTNQLEPKER